MLPEKAQLRGVYKGMLYDEILTFQIEDNLQVSWNLIDDNFVTGLTYAFQGEVSTTKNRWIPDYSPNRHWVLRDLLNLFGVIGAGFSLFADNDVTWNGFHKIRLKDLFLTFYRSGPG